MTDLFKQTAAFLAKYSKEVLVLELSHNNSNTVAQQKGMNSWNFYPFVSIVLSSHC
jgi:hypothetical protein